MSLLELPQYTFHGTPTQLGQAHGAALRAEIQAFVQMRFDATLEHLAPFGFRDLAPLLAVGRQCMDVMRNWHPAGHDEHLALSQAAGVDPVELYTAANMTDVRDVLTYGLEKTGLPADAEGCSAVLLPHTHTVDGLAMAAQTWDLNPQDIDYVVAIRRIPDRGPQTWTVTCTGCLALVGMNSTGLALGTTNIKTWGSKSGVGYTNILHAMLNAPDFATAARLCETAPRAAAHTYWLADAQRLTEWETTAWSAVRRDATDAPLTRTNHCLVAEHAAQEGEAPSSSSRARLHRMQAAVASGRQDADSLRTLFADRSDGVDSINRLAQDEQGTATNSVVIAIPGRRELLACKGSADQGHWIRLGFE